jgi:hypothetical protein
MELIVDSELNEISKLIESESISEKQWGEKESDDEFQTENYCGGYDADEKAFCFSYYSEEKEEYWFQFTSEEASLINTGKLKKLQARKAE